MQSDILYQFIETKLNTDLGELLSSARRDGVSYRRVAESLSESSGVPVSHTTVARWTKEHLTV